MSIIYPLLAGGWRPALLEKTFGRGGGLSPLLAGRPQKQDIKEATNWIPLLPTVF